MGQMEIWRHGGVETRRRRDMEARRHQTKTEAQVIFLNPFTVCSSLKLKFFVCPFVDEETNGSYPFANGLNGLSGLNGLNRLTGLAHLCTYCSTLSPHRRKINNSLIITA
jgi:hypothetical protein